MQQKTRHFFFKFHTVSRKGVQFDLERRFKPTYHLCIDLAGSCIWGVRCSFPRHGFFFFFLVFACTFLGLLAWLDPRNTVSPCRYKYIDIKRNINGKRKLTLHPVAKKGLLKNSTSRFSVQTRLQWLQIGSKSRNCDVPRAKEPVSSFLTSFLLRGRSFVRTICASFFFCEQKQVRFFLP